MMPMETLRDLFCHMEWADAAVWKEMLSHPTASADRRIHGLLYHLHLVQHSFHRAWTGVPRDLPYPEFSEAAAMMEWAKEWFPAAYEFLDTVDRAALPKTLNLPWAPLVERAIGRPAADTTLGDTLLQVPMHSHYHLAQVNARLKEVGGRPLTVDYIAWIWYGRPKAEWPYFSIT